MQARDVMTPEVVTVTPGTPVPEIARLLLDHNISALPVVNADGSLVGMVSEGDLGARSDTDRVGRRDWWLTLLADKSSPGEGVLEMLRAPGRTAADIMATPVVSVAETTDLAQVAQLLAGHRIKRVPVVQDGHLVGIVSRADILRWVATAGPGGGAVTQKPKRRGFLDEIFGKTHPPVREGLLIPGTPVTAPTQIASAATASGFRALESSFHRDETQHHDDVRLTAEKRRHDAASLLIDTHVSDENWRRTLQRARESAEHGATEWLILRFPSELCSDGARAINIADAAWPGTLRGEAAELYLRWERELKPVGFGISAHVLDFPEGKPGDVGLFLVWG